MSISEPSATDLSTDIADWLDRLNALATRVQEWASTTGWHSRWTSKHLTEPGPLRYEVPVLVLDRADVELALVPVARNLPDADGLVDLFLMPTYDPVASLHGEGASWFLHHVFAPEPTAPASVREARRLLLDEASLHRVLNDVARAAHA